MATGVSGAGRDGRWHMHIQEAKQRGSLCEYGRIGNGRWRAIEGGRSVNRHWIGGALTKYGNWVVGPDWVQLPPTSPLVLSSSGGERERERAPGIHKNFLVRVRLTREAGARTKTSILQDIECGTMFHNSRFKYMIIYTIHEATGPRTVSGMALLHGLRSIVGGSSGVRVGRTHAQRA